MQISETSNTVLAELLQAHTGQELSITRQWRIATVLSGLFRERGITSLDELMPLLARPHDHKLVREVVEALLNNETYFFRDRAPFDLLAHQALPELSERRARTRRISIWSAGCSSGQETLSLAMLFAAHPERWAGWTIDIFGTDVSETAIETARKAC